MSWPGIVRERQRRSLLAAAADLHLDLAGLQRAAPHGQPQRAPEQLRVGELLPRPGVAVVVEDFDPALEQDLVDAVAGLPLGGAGRAERDQVHGERSQRPGPGDPVLVGVLLDRRRHQAGRPDPVGGHPDRPLGAALVEVVGAEGLRVAGPELEDVAHLDRGLDGQPFAVAGEAVPVALHALEALGDLGVGGEALPEHDLVLARPAQGAMYSWAPDPPHHPDVTLDAVEAQAGALHDAVVGAHVERVAALEGLLVAVEAVGVLHDELPRPQDTGPGPGLVALLDLEVVEDQRQVAVGADDLGDVEGDRLLVGHRQHQLGALAVGELEQLLDPEPAGAAPQVGGLEHRHQHLLAADRVHLARG